LGSLVGFGDFRNFLGQLAGAGLAWHRFVSSNECGVAGVNNKTPRPARNAMHATRSQRKPMGINTRNKKKMERERRKVKKKGGGICAYN